MSAESTFFFFFFFGVVVVLEAQKIGDLGLDPQFICYLVMFLAHNGRSQNNWLLQWIRPLS